MTPTEAIAGAPPAFLGPGFASWSQPRPLLATVVLAAALALLAYASFRLARALLARVVAPLTERTRQAWDHALRGRRFFRRLSYVVPVLVVSAGLRYLPALPTDAAAWLRKLLASALVVLLARALSALVNAFGDVYAQGPHAAERPIKGYLQVIVLVGYLLAAVVVLAVVIERDPWVVLSGIGAASAVLLLVFRDTLLSLVAGMTITNNDLVRVGDWIEMPQFNADGFVVDIALNTVTVQNWDKTFTVIPTHQFLGHSFKNWRGMQASGGRRIKRSLLIDMSTVRFLTEEDVERLSRFALLRPYLEEKRRDIARWMEEHPEAREDPVNARRLTNLGTFRAYAERYLRSRPDIAQDMTFLVRQLAPSAEGLPLEVYVFVSDVRWAVYEGVQADVFDHLVAILPEFGLAVYQGPSGADLRALARAAPPALSSEAAAP
ncbi:MAG TPA: mechanosensitive ion channel domain-containing protein [Longimicrobiales bacterium]